MSEQKAYNKTFQRILLCGHLAKDPNLKFLADGTAVCNFGLVINRESGNGSDYIPCVAWKNKAKAIADYCKKGSLLMVEGCFKSSTFKDSEQRETFQLQFEVGNGKDIMQFLSLEKENNQEVVNEE